MQAGVDTTTVKGENQARSHISTVDQANLEARDAECMRFGATACESVHSNPAAAWLDASAWDLHAIGLTARCRCRCPAFPLWNANSAAANFSPDTLSAFAARVGLEETFSRESYVRRSQCYRVEQQASRSTYYSSSND